ncbi:MAG TPA: prepilin-type N-terminal cleavage/methylation domain-containing protein [Planctomycetota bacterium]|nr:prepilin-type N-terminal cleavage/methylation domain-containing protein [Planctomycetota bacterium]
MPIRTPNIPIARACGGFTLLELLVVIGVISVLLGLSVGFLGKTNPHMIAASILAGETRAAQVTARAEGLPTEVWVRPGVDGAPGTVQARLLLPVCTFHFEPNEGVLDETLRPALGGEDVPQGRFGHARRNRAGERGPLLRWPVPPSTADLRDGFAVRLDLKLEQRHGGTILQLGPTVSVQLDDELRPRARFRMHTVGGAGATPIAVQSPLPLPLGRWCTLDVVCDTRTAWLTLDDRELARAVAEGTPEQDPAGQFELSPGDSPVPGLVDEVRFLLYSFSPAQDLPRDLQPARVYRLAFDTRGEPTERPEVKFLLPEERP